MFIAKYKRRWKNWGIMRLFIKKIYMRLNLTKLDLKFIQVIRKITDGFKNLPRNKQRQILNLLSLEINV